MLRGTNLGQDKMNQRMGLMPPIDEMLEEERNQEALERQLRAIEDEERKVVRRQVAKEACSKLREKIKHKGAVPVA